jgi:hypothetical protein
MKDWFWSMAVILPPLTALPVFFLYSTHQASGAYQRALTTVIECRTSLSTQDSAKRLDICGPIPQRKDF